MYHPPFCEPTSFIFALLWFAPQQEWKIHGLWPETCKECENCGYPSYCRKNSIYFNVTDIKKLEHEIQTLWYPLQGLVEHEWIKHGGCDGNVTEYEYFNTTLALWSCFDYKNVCDLNKDECRILLSTQRFEQCINKN